MTRRNYSIIIAAGLLICLALNLYNRFVLVPRTMVTFEIHPLSIFCRFVTSPLSWIFMSGGMILAALIFRDGRGVPGQKWDTVLTVIGVLLLIVFWVMVILLYSGYRLPVHIRFWHGCHRIRWRFLFREFLSA